MVSRLIFVPIILFVAIAISEPAEANRPSYASHTELIADSDYIDPENVERYRVGVLRQAGYVVSVWRPEYLYGFPPNDFWALLEQAGWNLIVDYAPEFPPFIGGEPLPPIGSEIPEEPVLIEADLITKDGQQLYCLFEGEVAISPAAVIVTGCPIANEIACEEFVFADMNTFAPYVEAEECELFGPKKER